MHSMNNQTPLFMQLSVINGNKTICDIALMHVNLKKPQAKIFHMDDAFLNIFYNQSINGLHLKFLTGE